MNKRNIFIIVLVIFVLGLIAAPILYIGYLGFVPGLSDLMGTNKPRDLGVRYDVTDQKSAEQKFVTIANYMNEGIPKNAEPVKMTEGEISSAVAAWDWKDKPFSNVQVKIEKEGVIAVSGAILTEKLSSLAKSLNGDEPATAQILEQVKTFGKTVPFLAKTSLLVENGKAKIQVVSLEIGRFVIPATIINQVNQNIDSATLAGASSDLALENIEDIRYENGSITLVFKKK